tara:strand:+ start:276 stop:530 length:255 start_codon:yes stop_codon:yes gene_type:complete
MKRRKFKINKSYLFEAMQNKRVYTFAELERNINEVNGVISRLGRPDNCEPRYVCTRKKKDQICDALLSQDFNKDEIKNIFFEVE